MHKRRNYYRKKSKMMNKNQSKILTISIYNEESICVDNSYAMYSEELKKIYKKYKGYWDPQIKNWIIKCEFAKDLVKDVKELFKEQTIRINNIPAFVKRIMKSQQISQKRMLTFKGNEIS